MNKKPPVFIVVEDHPEVAENNCLFLKKAQPKAICIITATPQQALENLSLEQPELIVIDLQFGTITGEQSGKPGIDLLKRIFQDYPMLNILVYTSDPSLLGGVVAQINQHQGSFVVVNKMDRRSAFLEGVQSAFNGELRIPKDLQLHTKSALTEQDYKLMELICKESLSDRAIAEAMSISLRTAQNYVQRLKIKLGINLDEENKNSSRVALCMEAVRRKLISF